MEDTVVQKLAKSEAALTALQGKLDAEAKAGAEKILALEKSVAALSAERDQVKALADKAAADLAACSKQLDEMSAKCAAAEAKLADPSFKAASAPGVDPVPQGQKAAEPVTLASLEAAYMKENDPEKLKALRVQIFEMQKNVK